MKPESSSPCCSLGFRSSSENVRSENTADSPLCWSAFLIGDSSLGGLVYPSCGTIFLSEDDQFACHDGGQVDDPVNIIEPV